MLCLHRLDAKSGLCIMRIFGTTYNRKSGTCLRVRKERQVRSSIINFPTCSYICGQDLFVCLQCCGACTSMVVIYGDYFDVNMIYFF